MSNKMFFLKVFVTKNLKFRVKYCVSNFYPYTLLDINREVSIGGLEWKKGKGNEFTIQIMKKIENILIKLILEYLNHFKKYKNNLIISNISYSLDLKHLKSITKGE